MCHQMNAVVSGDRVERIKLYTSHGGKRVLAVEKFDIWSGQWVETGHVDVPNEIDGRDIEQIIDQAVTKYAAQFS